MCSATRTRPPAQVGIVLHDVSTHARRSCIPNRARTLVPRPRLGTGTEANVKLTAEIADGWIPMGFTPGMLDVYRPWLEEGFARAGNGKSLETFEIQAQMPTVVDDVSLAQRKRLKSCKCNGRKEVVSD